MVLLGWGPYIFEAGDLDYEKLNRKASGRWHDHELFGRAPAGQYLGPALREVEVAGTLYPRYCDGDPAAQLDAMMDAAEAGEAYELVSGLGDVWDTFRLESAGDKQSHIGPGGEALKIETSFKFKRLADPSSQVLTAWPAG